jgi:hypothetical protein
MGRNWQDFISGLKDNSGKFAKDELKSLITWAASEDVDFIKKQGEDLERHLTQLANGQVTKQQFDGYVRDMNPVGRMEALQGSVAAKAAAQRLADGIHTKLPS